MITTLALVLIVIVGSVGTLWWRQQVPLPTTALDAPVFEIGARPSFGLTSEAARGTITEVTVRLIQGDVDVVVFREEPATKRVDLDVGFELAGRGLREGEAVLEVHVTDDFWRPRSNGDAPALRVPVEIDLTAPRVSVRAATRYPVAGGAAVAVLAADGADDVWVEAAGRRFDSYEKQAGDNSLEVVLYGLPIGHPDDQIPVAVATDAAGNVSRVPLPVVLREQGPQIGSVELSAEWLRQKLPELLPGRTLAESELADAFLEVSRDQRAESIAFYGRLAKESQAERLWSGAFLQMPNSRNMSGFGSRRTYRFDGRDLDTQMHTGFDFASVKQAPIPVANDGKVVFTGPLSLYGNVVIVDHGWGLLTLYGHCSSLEVGEGDVVRKGQTIARTGATGLAAGDHLHFEVIVGGLAVTPVQWFDAAWIRDHIEAPLRDAGVVF